ncbi:hypothetical protein [Nocardioides panacisoli]|uniref:Lipoprotein n=1 Tax=Nocardioides panacisoli TaxID=627624 RepID=A0ABP7HW28_9ACTN
MRTPLGPARAALVAALLACGLASACGGGDDSHASDPATSSAAPSSGTTTSSGAQPRVLDVVAAPASGSGEVDPTPVDISTTTGFQVFAKSLGPGTLADQVQAVADRAKLADGLRPYAAIIAIGCDVPDALITGGPGDWQVVAAKVASPKPECFVANMSVAVVALPG